MLNENIIFLKGMRIYAYHGAFPQEQKTGANYTVDIRISTDFSKAIQEDDLSGTINYADIHETIKWEMEKPSKLLEHVAGRIITSVFKQYKSAKTIQLSIVKENPPMGADCIGAGVEINACRESWKTE